MLDGVITDNYDIVIRRRNYFGYPEESTDQLLIFSLDFVSHTAIALQTVV